MTNGTDKFNQEIRPFRIDIPEAELKDLRSRLGQIRWLSLIHI